MRAPARSAPPAARSWVLGTLALVALTVGACGKKGDPQPPLRLVPKAASDLAVRQRGSELLLTVSYPSVAANGMALPGLAAVEVWQRVQPVAESAAPPPPEPRQFQAAAEIAATLSGDELSAAVTGDRVGTSRPLAAPVGEPRQLHTFGVRFVSLRGERSELSNLAAILPLPPPRPPTGLGAEAREDGIGVTWEETGEEVAAYHVYRRAAEEKGYGQALARVGAGEERYLDDDARLGSRYIYTVTAVAATDPVVESALGAEREVDYRDRFPPPPPSDLVALAEAGQVRLSWRASEAADVAGYHVYRQDEPGGEFARRTAEAAAATRFLDADLEPGRTYRYRVTAVDASGNESAPGAEVESTAL